MGGVIGAVSTKFVVKAGLLLLFARVDMYSVQAVLDPSTPYTRVAPDLARRLRAADGGDDADGAVRGFHVVGIDRLELRLRAVRPAARDAAAPLTIGNDLLAQGALELDFAHGRLRLLEPHDVARAARGLARVPLAAAASGCLEAGAMRADGTPATVALAADAAPPAGAIPVTVGPARLVATMPSATARACSAGFLNLGWDTFGKGRIIIDLPSRTLWVTPAA